MSPNAPRSPALRNVVRNADKRQPAPLAPRSRANRALTLAARNVAAVDTLVELLSDDLDALGGGAERGRDRGLRRLAAIGRNHAGVLQGRKFLLQALESLPRLGELVRDGQRGHHGQSGIADLAEFAAQSADAHVEIARKLDEVAFLAVLA